MDPRFNHKHLIQSRHLPAHQDTTRQEPRRPARSSKPVPRPAHCPCAEPVHLPTGAQAVQALTLENEIPVTELNHFALSCIEQLWISGQDQPAEKLITTAISEKLPSYTGLKAELSSCRQTHRSHHQWTKQVYAAVEPLLKLEQAPSGEQQKLSDLTLQCVEQDLQLQYRLEQLALRAAFLEKAVPEQLIQIGLEIGLPSALMGKIGKLVNSLMKRHA